MTSNWALPRTISQYAEDGAESAHIAWEEIDSFSAIKTLDNKSIKTVSDLIHIARDPKHDIKQKTYFLKITNFNFENVPSIVSGIELRLSMNRYGRITDDTIQLTLNDQLIGANNANFDLVPIKLYGGENLLWDASLSSTDIANPSFGVVLRFQSHPRWPHKSGTLIDAVEIRIH
jgi:hypothetical protein